MARQLNSVDDFLNHKGASGGGAGFLGKWKKPADQGGGGGKVNTWLHPKRLPIALWQHNLPTIVVRQDRQTDETIRNVWSRAYGCLEPESVLQNRQRDDNGRRVAPFERCPVCRMIEFVRQAVDEGSLSWTDTLFRWEGDEGTDGNKQVQVLHAGGLYGAFGGDDHTDEEKAQLRAAKIFVKDAWKENALAKLNYLFCVIDNANPAGGVQVAIETALLGEKVKTVIADARDSLGEEAGNPYRNPYCIQWQHRPSEKEFSKKYHALRMEQIKLNPDIVKLLKGPPPDVSKHLETMNPETMRAMLEKHCIVKKLKNGRPFPWDEIFTVKPAEEEGDATFTPEEEHADSTTEAAAPDAPTSSKEPVEDNDAVPCEACGHEFPQDQSTCPKCGAEYDADGNLVKKPEPPPKGRKRGEAKAGGTKLPF